MATHFTRTTGPHVTSSVRSSQSTTVTTSSTNGANKFTHGTIGGTLGGTLGGMPLTAGQSHQFITGTTPYVTTSTTRYSNTAPTLMGQTPFSTQGSLLTGGSLLGSLMPTTGLMPTLQHQPMYYSRVAAPMAVSAPMGLGTPNDRQNTSAASSRMVSSMDINGVHCEGALGLSDTAIVEAQNIFVGIAPFVLDHASLEVTPEFSVVTRNPDIKFHLAALPEGAPLTLAQLRTLAGMENNTPLHVALPGQQSFILSQEADGTLKVTNQPTSTTMGGTVLGTLRM